MRDKERHFIYSLNMKEERAKNSQGMVLKKKNKETVWENMKICSTLLVIRLTKIKIWAILN